MLRASRVIAFILLSFPAVATPPPGTDLSGEVHQWFERQTAHGGSLPCCAEMDGHVLNEEEWRIKGDAYQVFVEGEWRDVPKDAVVDPGNGANPLGKPVVWYMDILDEVVIWCFVPGTMG